MSIEAQAAALAEASVIVGVHGSALTDILFAAPRALVVDLMPADLVGYRDVDPPAERWLLNLSTALGLDYRLVLCPSRMIRILPEVDRRGWQHFEMEATVDLGLLGLALDGASPAAGNATQGPDHTLAALANPALEPLFRHPDRRGIHSASWGHVPFAEWLVRAARPNSIVELGSFAGVSYFAFCQAVLAERLDCACHAVDTWQGDAHAGRYDDSVWRDVQQFNDARYSRISTLYRCTFDEALSRFEDGSMDVLTSTGSIPTRPRATTRDWLPKMSDRGIVLFHDTTERRADFEDLATMGRVLRALPVLPVPALAWPGRPGGRCSFSYGGPPALRRAARACRPYPRPLRDDRRALVRRGPFRPEGGSPTGRRRFSRGSRQVRGAPGAAQRHRRQYDLARHATNPHGGRALPLARAQRAPYREARVPGRHGPDRVGRGAIAHSF